MSDLKVDGIIASTGTNTNLTLEGKGTGGVKITDYLVQTKGADIGSATSLTLGKDGNQFDVTGTTTITSIGTQGIGSYVTLHFDGALTFTHHSTDLILPGAANITTAAGDIAVMYEYASADWRCVSYTKASGEAVVVSSSTPDLLIYTDQEASGSSPGDNHTVGSFKTITLNTEVTDSGGHGSLSTSQITLAAGTYDIYAIAYGASSQNDGVSRFRNVTDGATLVVGMAWDDNGQNVVIQGDMHIVGRFTLSGSKACEFQVYPLTSTLEMGKELTTGEVNIAALVKLEKVS
jgi:hypothetical protein